MAVSLTLTGHQGFTGRGGRVTRGRRQSTVVLGLVGTGGRLTVARDTDTPDLDPVGPGLTRGTRLVVDTQWVPDLEGVEGRREEEKFKKEDQ